jgi:hypothetical protein
MGTACVVAGRLRHASFKSHRWNELIGKWGDPCENFSTTPITTRNRFGMCLAIAVMV